LDRLSDAWRWENSKLKGRQSAGYTFLDALAALTIEDLSREHEVSAFWGGTVANDYVIPFVKEFVEMSQTEIEAAIADPWILAFRVSEDNETLNIQAHRQSEISRFDFKGFQIIFNMSLYVISKLETIGRYYRGIEPPPPPPEKKRDYRDAPSSGLTIGIATRRN